MVISTNFNKINTEVIKSGLCTHCGTCVGLNSNILEFKEGMFVDFDLIQEKIEDAGFFLGETEIIFENNMLISNDAHNLINNNLFHFFSEVNKESKVFKLVDKNFVNKKEFDELSNKTNHTHEQ